jgi:hypothetical protein
VWLVQGDELKSVRRMSAAGALSEFGHDSECARLGQD